jgi:predicted RNase H-like HicB family nuclease
MEYPVIVEQNNGIWRAIIPALSDLSAEGVSYDEAVQNARQSAEAFLAKVKITTIEVNSPQPTLRPGSPRALLKALEAFAGDEEALREHFEEIAKERQRQREEAQREDAG